MTEFTVAVLRNPTEHKIKLQQVAKWAGADDARGTGRSLEAAEGAGVAAPHGINY
jgi:hypothetical protein